MNPAGGSAITLRLGVAVASLLALVVAGAAASLARPDTEAALDTPRPVPAGLATELMTLAAGTPATGVPASGGRRTVLEPSWWRESEGPCATTGQPRCALVAVYDYATNVGYEVIMSVDAAPAVVEVRSGAALRVPLSPDEGKRGFEIALALPEVQALLASGYRATLSHDFAPGTGDACARVRCVIVDFVNAQGHLHAGVIDLTNERVIQASWD